MVNSVPVHFSVRNKSLPYNTHSFPYCPVKPSLGRPAFWLPLRNCSTVLDPVYRGEHSHVTEMGMFRCLLDCL